MSTSKLEKPLGPGPVEEALQRQTLRSLCRDPAVTVRVGASLSDALAKLRDPASRGAVVVLEAAGLRPAGIFTERDVLDKLALADLSAEGHAELQAAVDSAMTPSPKTLQADATVAEVIRWMTEGGYRHVPVVASNGELVGLVTTHDVVMYLAHHFPADILNLPPDPHQHNEITTREGG